MQLLPALKGVAWCRCELVSALNLHCGPADFRVPPIHRCTRAALSAFKSVNGATCGVDLRLVLVSLRDGNYAGCVGFVLQPFALGWLELWQLRDENARPMRVMVELPLDKPVHGRSCEKNARTTARAGTLDPCSLSDRRDSIVSAAELSRPPGTSAALRWMRCWRRPSRRLGGGSALTHEPARPLTNFSAALSLH
jgi:hypothetical protein